jgi:hypothetical protein
MFIIAVIQLTNQGHYRSHTPKRLSRIVLQMKASDVNHGVNGEQGNVNRWRSRMPRLGSGEDWDGGSELLHGSGH